MPEVHGIAVAGNRQVRVVSIGNLPSTTRSNQSTQPRKIKAIGLDVN